MSNSLETIRNTEDRRVAVFAAPVYLGDRKAQAVFFQLAKATRRKTKHKRCDIVMVDCMFAPKFESLFVLKSQSSFSEQFSFLGKKLVDFYTRVAVGRL
jgi:hypothetical protein